MIEACAKHPIARRKLTDAYTTIYTFDAAEKISP